MITAFFAFVFMVIPFLCLALCARALDAAGSRNCSRAATSSALETLSRCAVVVHPRLATQHVQHFRAEPFAKASDPY
jgi:hypothetical protein